MMQRAHRALQMHAFGDDVVGGAAHKLPDGHHRRMQWLDFPADHGLRFLHKGRRRHDGVNRRVRMRGMAGFALDDQVKPVRRRKAGAAHITKATHRHIRVVVKANRHINAIRGAIGDHGRCPFQHFFRRLEDKAHGPGKLRRQILEHRRHTQKGGGMDIMSASMHLPGDFTREGQRRFLMDRQRVHIGADRKRGARAPALDFGNHPGAAHACARCQAKARQFRRHNPGGAGFLKGQFWVRMDIAPDFNQPRRHCLGRFADAGFGVIRQAVTMRHGGFPVGAWVSCG